MYMVFELIKKYRKVYITILSILFIIASIILVIIPDRYGVHEVYIGFYTLLFALAGAYFGIVAGVLTIAIYFAGEIWNSTLELSLRVASAGVGGLIFCLFLVFLVNSIKTLYFSNKETLAIVEKSKARYQRIVDNIKEGMLIISKEGVLIFLNWSASNILGISVTDVNRNIRELFGDDSLLLIGTDYTKRKNLSSESSISYVHPEKGQRRLLVVTLPYSEQYEGVPSLVAFIQDTTDLDEAKIKYELELKKNYLLLREIDHRIGNYMSIINAYLRFYIGDEDISKTEGLIKIGEVVHLLSRISTRYFSNFEQQTLRMDTIIEEINDDLLAINMGNCINPRLELIPVEMHVDLVMPIALLCAILLFNAYDRVKNSKNEIDFLIKMTGVNGLESICFSSDKKNFFLKLKSGTDKKIEEDIINALLQQINGSIRVIKPFSNSIELSINNLP